jgi:hypothetical protein
MGDDLRKVRRIGASNIDQDNPYRHAAPAPSLDQDNPY